MNVTTWDLPPDAWAAMLARCPNATFFHTPAWYWAHRHAGYAPRAVAFETADGREALLPLATQAGFRGLLAVAYAGIENGYGGLVSPEPLTPAEVEAAYALVRKRFPDLQAVGNPFEAYDNLPPDGERTLDATQVVPLLAPDAQLALAASTRRKQVRRAAKAGFTIEVVHPVGAADAARFYPLYGSRAGEWAYQRWIRDEAYFRELCAGAGDQLALLLATRGGELAGFRLLGLHGPVVMDLFLATDPAHEADHVGPLLAAEAMAWCHARGHERFDFQPSGRLDGVKAYKASFGATDVPHAVTRHQGKLGGALGGLRKAVLLTGN